MNLNLSFLTSFLAVASTGSFTSAAQELCLTQPAVSQQVQALEEELGVSLFVRRGRGVALTEEGQILRKKTQEILSILNEISVNIQDRNELRRGQLNLAVTESIAYLIPTAVLEFKKSHPGVDVRLYCGKTPVIVRMVGDGEMDFAIAGAMPSAPKALQSQLVHVDALVLAAPPNHPLAKKNKISAENLYNITLAMREQGALTREYAAKWLSESCVPVSVMEANTMAFLREMALHGSIAFLPQSVVAEDFKRNRLVPVSAALGKVDIKYHLYTRKNAALNKAAAVFLEILGSSGRLSHGQALSDLNKESA